MLTPSDAKEWFEGRTVEPWLAEIVRLNMGSPSLCDRFVAAGAVLVLSRHRRAGRRVRAEVAPGDGPPQCVERTLLAVGQYLDRSVADMVVATAMNRVYALMENVDSLVDVKAPEGMRMLCYARDDLSCLEVALRVAGFPVDDLSSLLVDADRQVIAILHRLPAVPEDDRLSEVAATFPMSWWTPAYVRRVPSSL